MFGPRFEVRVYDPSRLAVTALKRFWTPWRAIKYANVLDMAFYPHLNHYVVPLTRAEAAVPFVHDVAELA